MTFARCLNRPGTGPLSQIPGSGLSKTARRRSSLPRGFRLATSVGGTLTGRGRDIIVIDDPLKPDDASAGVRLRLESRLRRIFARGRICANSGSPTDDGGIVAFSPSMRYPFGFVTHPKLGGSEG